jgi:hypothetical protein
MGDEAIPWMTSTGKPKKFLLHMARIGDDWAGTAICINQDERIRFASLTELLDWLDRFEGDAPSGLTAADPATDEE